MRAVNQFDISYGISEFDLSELLTGERIIQLISPIRNYHKSANSGGTQPGKPNQGILCFYSLQIKRTVNYQLNVFICRQYKWLPHIIVF